MRVELLVVSRINGTRLSMLVLSLVMMQQRCSLLYLCNSMRFFGGTTTSSGIIGLLSPSLVGTLSSEALTLAFVLTNGAFE